MMMHSDHIHNVIPFTPTDELGIGLPVVTVEDSIQHKVHHTVGNCDDI